MFPNTSYPFNTNSPPWIFIPCKSKQKGIFIKNNGMIKVQFITLVHQKRLRKDNFRRSSVKTGRKTFFNSKEATGFNVENQAVNQFQNSNLVFFQIKMGKIRFFLNFFD
jgi:hypothetical protein